MHPHSEKKWFTLIIIHLLTMSLGGVHIIIIQRLIDDPSRHYYVNINVVKVLPLANIASSSTSSIWKQKNRWLTQSNSGNKLIQIIMFPVLMGGVFDVVAVNVSSGKHYHQSRL
jgi:hypothetical protein